MTFGKENGITEFTFSENVNISSCDSDDEIFEEDEELERIRNFWGRNFNTEDLQRLEYKFAEWSNGNKIERQNDRSLLKLVCLKELKLEKTIMEDKPTGPLEKEYQDLLKTAALTPAQASVSSSASFAGKIGTTIERIEKLHPADYYGDLELFKNFNHLDRYCYNYIGRPVENFFSGNKNYELIDEDDSIDNTNDGTNSSGEEG
jgi:hypothetical protein